MRFPAVGAGRGPGPVPHEAALARFARTGRSPVG
ncbi:hypothetical protein SUDANB171_00181 [Streptomyces sp. enrichment culture]